MRYLLTLLLILAALPARAVCDDDEDCPATQVCIDGICADSEVDLTDCGGFDVDDGGGDDECDAVDGIDADDADDGADDGADADGADGVEADGVDAGDDAADGFTAGPSGDADANDGAADEADATDAGEGTDKSDGGEPPRGSQGDTTGADVPIDGGITDTPSDGPGLGEGGAYSQKPATGCSTGNAGLAGGLVTLAVLCLLGWRRRG